MSGGVFRAEHTAVSQITRDAGSRVLAADFKSHGMQVGAFVVQFTITSQHDKSDMLRTDVMANTKVIPLDEEVLARRIVLT